MISLNNRGLQFSEIEIMRTKEEGIYGLSYSKVESLKRCGHFCDIEYVGKCCNCLLSYPCKICSENSWRQK